MPVTRRWRRSDLRGGRRSPAGRSGTARTTRARLVSSTPGELWARRRSRPRLRYWNRPTGGEDRFSRPGWPATLPRSRSTDGMDVLYRDSSSRLIKAFWGPNTGWRTQSLASNLGGDPAAIANTASWERRLSRRQRQPDQRLLGRRKRLAHIGECTGRVPASVPPEVQTRRGLTSSLLRAMLPKASSEALGWPS
jgi:hypothetical protein